MVLVSVYCAQLLDIKVRLLREKLTHPADREAVLRLLKGKQVRTTYADRNGFKKTFFIDGLTTDGAAHVMAYGRLPRPYNINVAAHYFARHRIRLHNPYMQCVVEHPIRGEDRFYPMELLEIVDDASFITGQIQAGLGRVFTKIRDRHNSSKTESSEESDDDETLTGFQTYNDDFAYTGRALCSQGARRY
uniref:PAZ domain-containing protein n=1 Tax=Globodera rostochiensis TaxID=31243 RepID=A0A914IEI4_GLORO